MGLGKRFEIKFSLSSFLIGYTYGDFRYDHDITIHLGFGKSYLKRELK